MIKFKTIMKLCALVILLINCENDQIRKVKTSDDNQYSIEITIEEANKLSNLPFDCIQLEYPNKLNQVLNGVENLQEPKVLHPAFYGCFDWHSSVHGHWSLVTLLKRFPQLEKASDIRERLRANLIKDNISEEIEYFKVKNNESFERTYGWAWLLKLAEELHTWNDPLGRELENNLNPLIKVIIDKYLEFLPKLNYPIRVGEHTNTAFGLTFAYDYSETVEHTVLKELIIKRAKEFYFSDKNCPITWEPSGFDFLSPCLEEADLMRRVLSKKEFQKWIKMFLPQLLDVDFQLEPGKVSDRTDGKLAHLDGLNFSRAWSLKGIANEIPEYKHLEKIAFNHIKYSLPSIVDGNYEGSHWLGSFAIYALYNSEND